MKSSERSHDLPMWWGVADMSTPDEIQAATDRIADQVRRLLTRETTFAELCEFIQEELRNAYETNQQEKMK